MILQCTNKQLDLSKQTCVMGILNVTPDSFSDGGSYSNTNLAVEHAIKMAEDGAQIVDIGAQSTRPGYVEISPAEEIKRLGSIAESILAQCDVLLSIDTYFPAVAAKAIEQGVSIINDVSGEFNESMAALVKKTRAAWVIMHSGAGTPKQVNEFFNFMLKKATAFGINEQQLCFDPGVGFGKTYEQNLQLIVNVSQYKIKDRPLLMGLSKKRVVATASGAADVSQRTAPSVAANACAILCGANIIRVHNVKEEAYAAKMIDALSDFKSIEKNK